MEFTLEEGRPFRLVGLRRDFTPAERGAIPGLWSAFSIHIGAVPGEVAGAAYGAVFLGPAESEAFGYMAAVEARPGAPLPAGFADVLIDAPRYARAWHGGHVARVHETVGRLFRALPADAIPARPAGVELIERYGADFNPQTGEGGIDILIPLRA